MLRALALAERGVGRVSPNPPVGAVAVRDGAIVGEGWHRAFGGPHAEADLIARAGAACRGADLYVTLEPCDHHGKTPPCSEAVIAAGFRRVFIACDDPNPVTSGRSAPRFAAAGIEVVRGVEEAAARRLLAPYLCRTIAGRPLVTAKWAMTADGRVADATGDAKWISAEETRRRTRAGRSRFDAILIGSGTARSDDPLLTARTRGRPDPARVVADSALALALDSRLVATAREVPLLVAASEGRAGEPGFAARRAALESAGAEVEILPADGAGRVSLPGLLAELARRGVCHLLVEGGPGLLGALFDARLIDRVLAVISPKLIGGARAPGPIGGSGIDRMAAALDLSGATWRASGPDRILEGSITPVGEGVWPARFSSR